MNNFLLQEDGTFLLQESGFKIILDEAAASTTIQTRRMLMGIGS